MCISVMYPRSILWSLENVEETLQTENKMRWRVRRHVSLGAQTAYVAHYSTAHSHEPCLLTTSLLLSFLLSFLLLCCLPPTIFIPLCQSCRVKVTGDNTTPCRVMPTPASKHPTPLSCSSGHIPIRGH
jgi:hypothetical protein